MSNPNIKYLEYIRNTGRKLLPIEMFDDDWDPIGPRVRKILVDLGLIVEEQGFLALTYGTIYILESNK